MSYSTPSNPTERSDTQRKIATSATTASPFREKGSNQPSNHEHIHRDSDEHVSQDAQAGVQKIQAAAAVWSRKHLIAAHVL
jgi:hypothetical protein